MKIDYLMCFQAVAKYKNFTKAADALFISQSSLSKRIQTLEDYLGGSLFIRNNGAVALSSFGEYVSNLINNVVEDYDVLLSATENYHVNHSRKMTVATFLNVAHSGLLKPIIAFESGEDNFYIETMEKDHSVLKQQLATRQAEVCFGYYELLGEAVDYKITPLFEDQLILITSKQFAEKMGWGDVINLSDARTCSFCFPREDMELFTHFINTCKSYGFVPQLTNSDVRLGTIREYISVGMRCTLQYESISKSKFYNKQGDNSFAFIKLENCPKLTMSMFSDSTRPRRIRDSFVEYISNYYNVTQSP